MNNCSTSQRPWGNSRDYALRRLRKNAPSIHARVIAGELSPRQGMIAAGFLHEPTPLEMLHRYWRKVSLEERVKFLIEMLMPAEHLPQGRTAPHDAAERQ